MLITNKEVKEFQATFINYPVGQGGFYIGKIPTFDGTFNFVYDCGSSSKKIYLDEAISRYKKNINGHGIDMLVISHFDMDHISGIEDLLKDIHHVDYVVIPYYAEYTLILFELILLVNNVPFEIINKIIIVTSQNDFTSNDKKKSTENEEDILNAKVSQDIKDKAIFKSDLDINSAYKSPEMWKFLFFNHKKNFKGNNSFGNQIASIRKDLDKLLKDKTLIQAFSKNSKEVKEAYDGIFKKPIDRNNISLCMYHEFQPKPYSSSSIPDSFSLELRRSNCIIYSKHEKNEQKVRGTLLTGDISLANEDIYKSFCGWANKYDIFKNIHFFDLPHHGANKNWNSDLIKNKNFDKKCKDIIFFSNAGLQNTFGHPSIDVLTDIYNANLQYISVNEETELSYSYYYPVDSYYSHDDEHGQPYLETSKGITNIFN